MTSISEIDGRTGRIHGVPYWIWRRLWVIACSAIATYLFMESRAEWIAMHRWNRALADSSLVLVALHTAYFLYIHFQDFHREVPPPNWLQAPFVVLVLAVAVMRNAAFFRTWWSTARRVRVRRGAPPDARKPTPTPS